MKKTIVIQLEIEGDVSYGDAVDVVDNFLDGGALQDSLNEFAEDGGYDLRVVSATTTATVADRFHAFHAASCSDDPLAAVCDAIAASGFVPPSKRQSRTDGPTTAARTTAARGKKAKP